MSLRLVYLSSSVLVSFASVGCTRWHIQPLTPRQVILEQHPKRVRVTLSDSSIFILEEPGVSGDSITGMTGRARLSIATAQVARVEVMKKDRTGTWALISLIVAAAWASGGGPGGGAPRISF